VYPFAGELDPEPALAGFPGPAVALPTPDLAALMAADPPLARVMEERRSIRQFGADPLTAGQLGEFLYRVARVRSAFEVAASDEVFYEVTDRPLPAGGAAHDLEFYVTAVRCDGLAPGIYHYRPAEHALTLVTAEPKWVVGMANEAYRCAGAESVPQALITLASRFARLTWKYRGIAHALTLKNVGVAYEAMYLAATAMGLAPCALGHGNAALFSRATGLDPLIESSVGEFLIGTKRT
jgi:SagB-type dehydrogenase family enzyme